MAAGNKPVTCRNLRKAFLLFWFFEPENSPKNVHLKCCKDTNKRTSTRMPFLFGEIEPTRFERSNADVRWTSARTRLDGFDTMIFFPLGRKCNKSGRYPDALDAASKVLRRHKISSYLRNRIRTFSFVCCDFTA